jgi:hypothetical protein
MPSKKRSRAKLVKAIAEQRMLRVERAPKFADRLDGFVVAVGDEWALLAQSSDGGFFNGYVAFRLSDVKRIKPDKTFEPPSQRLSPSGPRFIPSRSI